MVLGSAFKKANFGRGNARRWVLLVPQSPGMCTWGTHDPHACSPACTYSAAHPRHPPAAWALIIAQILTHGGYFHPHTTGKPCKPFLRSEQYFLPRILLQLFKEIQSFHSHDRHLLTWKKPLNPPSFESGQEQTRIFKYTQISTHMQSLQWK